MAELVVHCVGVGSGWPAPDEGFSAFLIQGDGTQILCDCGEPVTARLKQKRISLSAIDAILLSHMHVDHVGGLFMLLQAAWLERRTRPLPIYLPHHAIEPIQDFLPHLLLPPGMLSFEIQWHPLQERAPFQIGPLQIEPRRTLHLENLKQTYPKGFPEEAESFGFLIQNNHLRIVYTGDIADDSDLFRLIDRPVHLLICELAHCEPERLFTQIATLPIQRTAFVHISPENRDHLNTLRQMAEKVIGPGRVLFPKAGESWIIRG